MLNVLFTQESWRKGLVGLLLIVGSGVAAQPALLPQRTEAIHINSGVHSVPADLSDSEAQPVFRETVRIPGARWLRLLFEDYDLGERSYITITSLEDGASQRLDAQGLAQWQGSSAYFNGDAVSVELNVYPGDENIFFRLVGARIGDPAPSMDADEKQNFHSSEKVTSDDVVIPQCQDDRSSTDNFYSSVGRIIRDDGSNQSVICTGWIASNGAHLTSGACAKRSESSVIVVEFNVPESDTNGEIDHPAPADQYVINPESVVYDDDPNGYGKNWGVFDVHSNTETGLVPVQAYGGFFRVKTNTLLQGQAQVIGYGENSGSLNNTQQESFGNLGFLRHPSSNRAYWEHEVYSDQTYDHGGPLVHESYAIGIYSNGGCEKSNPNARVYSKATSFVNEDLESEIETFSGSSVTYVDNEHSSISEDGTVFKPFDTVAEGVSAAVSEGILSIVTGTYSETFTINKAMRIEAPVGTVTIDPTAAASVVGGADSLQNNIVGLAEDAPATFRLEQNQPNPVIRETQIEIVLPEASHVSLAVYDILGREVTRLIDGEMEAGVHTIRLDASTLSSGVYVYHLRAGDFTQSRRMLVVR